MGAGTSERTVATDTEPDYRFTLANERTFLAWIRTAMGMLAGGVAVHQLAPPFDIPFARTALALACLALAVVLPFGAYRRWQGVQRAIRRGKPLPGTLLVPLMAVGLIVIALLATVAVALS